jgi:Ni/Co efflux regulator RcnB
MNKRYARKLVGFILGLLLALGLGGPAAWAEKPQGAGQGKDKSHKHDKHDKHDKAAKKNGKPGSQPQVGGYFGDAQRQAARNYYGTQARSGHCPPGLAKKNNGCLPPGQAKKWGLGKPLPVDVVHYPVPSSVVVKLGPPPIGHKYVRVAADILLIAVGTGIVIDAIEDLARL